MTRPLINAFVATANTDNNSFAVRLSAAPEYVANSRHQFGHWLNDIAIAC